MLKAFQIIFFTFLMTIPAIQYAQGCVAIRGNSSCGASTSLGSLSLMKGDLQMQSAFRFFKSFRHFRGSEEEVHRIADGTEVINHSYFLDLSVSYGLSERFFATAIIPFVYHTRSSMYEHGGNPPNGLGERQQTSSKGLSDMRISASYWLLNPSTSNFNYSFGLGVKLPTGKYDYMDTFYNQGDNRDIDVENVVDQSIQPGDGGWGITTEFQGFHSFGSHFGMSTSLYYLLNFQETNGVLTRNGSSLFSCPDQFGVTISSFYSLNNGLSVSLGGRLEGVPSSDLIGGSAGYRRPGYAISIEPGIGFAKNNLSLFLSVPIAMVRNRTQSYQDKEQTQQTGVYRHGDAAFADYLINFTTAYRINSNHHQMMPEMKNFEVLK